MKKILLLFLLCAVVNCKAQKKLDSLLNELAKHSQEDTVKIKLLTNISVEYENIDADKGIAFAVKAVNLSKKYNWQKGLARAYMILAQNYQTLGKDTVAIGLCRQALVIANKINDVIRAASVYETIGISYFDLSDWSMAIKYEEAGLALVKKINKKDAEGDFLNSIGVDYEFLGDYVKALQYFQQAISVRESTGQNDLNADVFLNIGLVYNRLNDYDKALLNYNEALKINSASSNKINTADCYGNIATVYDEKGDTIKSRYFYRKNLQLAQEAFYNHGILSAEMNLGISYSHTANYDSALLHLNSALALAKESGDKSNTSIALNYISNSYLKAPDKILRKFAVSNTEKLNEALKMQLQSINIAIQIKDIEELMDGYENLSEIYEAKKYYADAYTAYKKSTEYKDSLVNDDTKQQITRVEMQYQFSKTQDSVKAINDKEKTLATAEIQKQRITKNATMAGAGFLILAGIGGFVFYKRNRDIKLQKNKAQLQQQITETELKALRAQMNPHFIFNSLNSIADYIDKNQPTIASDFAVKFAKLMRMVLENSEQKTISLSDDLKALELYMQLESLRLKNKFFYTIKVDKCIDADNTLVPPLILQPFVENSIWHGIANKQGNGHITIYIKQEGEMINCIVEDDGEGIKAQSNQTQEKKSLGMKITKARIDIINKIKNTNASVKITSKENGVRAEVRLPLELSF